jgi:hypothetical protein
LNVRVLTILLVLGGTLAFGGVSWAGDIHLPKTGAAELKQVRQGRRRVLARRGALWLRHRLQGRQGHRLPRHLRARQTLSRAGDRRASPTHGRTGFDDGQEALSGGAGVIFSRA